MSIKYVKDDCTLLCHKTYIDNIYKNYNLTSKTFEINEDLFNINSRYLRDNQKLPTETKEIENVRKCSKINKKKANILINKNANTYELVSFLRFFEMLTFSLFILNY